MKKVMLSVVAITGLMAMSFTTVNSNKVCIVKNSVGFELTNANSLSLDDLTSLEKMTVTGLNTTTLVNTSVSSDWVNETVYATADYAPSQEQEAKLNSILTKY